MFGRFVNTVMLEGMCWHCHVGSVDLTETLLSYCTIKSIICAIANICDSLLLSGQPTSRIHNVEADAWQFALPLTVAIK